MEWAVHQSYICVAEDKEKQQTGSNPVIHMSAPRKDGMEILSYNNDKWR